jgi:peptidoglycan/xylan/chitin deacetylase (PgdA/CDA1 family)
MTDPLPDEPRYLTELPDDLKLKRAATARRRRWRRRLTVGALVAVVAAVAAVVVTALGGDDSGEQEPAAQQPAQHAGGPPEEGPSFPAGWAPHPGPVPILAYGSIETPDVGESFPELFVEPQGFEDQMRWLDQQGFEAVTLDQVEDAWYGQGELPVKPIVVSFDDGYSSQYENAFPVLSERDWPAVLNLPTEGAELPDAEVEKLLDAGWELASKATNEFPLTAVDPATLETEVAGSRRILRQRFGVPVRNFCYPSGSYDTTVISAVHRAGYVGAQTEISGIADAGHPYILDRVQILLSDGRSGFISKLQAVGALE